jgi:hypothetical protein
VPNGTDPFQSLQDVALGAGVLAVAAWASVVPVAVRLSLRLSAFVMLSGAGLAWQLGSRSPSGGWWFAWVLGSWVPALAWLSWLRADQRWRKQVGLGDLQPGSGTRYYNARSWGFVGYCRSLMRNEQSREHLLSTQWTPQWLPRWARTSTAPHHPSLAASPMLPGAAEAQFRELLDRAGVRGPATVVSPTDEQIRVVLLSGEQQDSVRHISRLEDALARVVGQPVTISPPTDAWLRRGPHVKI